MRISSVCQYFQTVEGKDKSTYKIPVRGEVMFTLKVDS